MTFRMIAATLLLALPAASAEPVLPQLRVEPTAGGSIFFIKNVSSQPLTAFVIELVGYPGSFFVTFEDQILSEVIAPDGEKKMQVGNMTVGAVPDYVKLQAAIYADGTTAGVPDRIALLVARRRSTLDAVRDILHRLEAAQEGKMTNEAAAASLKNALERTMLPPGAGKMSQPSIDLAAKRMVYSQAADYAGKHSLDESLAKVHQWEKALAASKPAL